MNRFAPMALGLLLLASASAAGAAPRGRDAPEDASGSRDKMVCKRFVKTGSLVDGYRTCKTKWEWERERENVRQLSVADSCRNRGAGGDCN